MAFVLHNDFDTHITHNTLCPTIIPLCPLLAFFIMSRQIFSFLNLHEVSQVHGFFACFSLKTLVIASVLKMTSRAQRVFEWLDHLQPALLDAHVGMAETQSSTEDDRVPILPNTESAYPTPMPEMLPTSKIDGVSEQEAVPNKGTPPCQNKTIQHYSSDSFYMRASNQQGMIRIRELGLIAVEDFDHLSMTKIAEFAGVSQYQSPRTEEPWVPAPVLNNESHLENGSTLVGESKTARIGEPGKDSLHDSPRHVDVLQGSLSQSSEEACGGVDYSHATAPYPRESRKLSLVTDEGIECEKLRPRTSPDLPKPEVFHTHPKEDWHSRGLSSKQARVISVDLSAHDNNKETQKTTYEGIGAGEAPYQRLKFQKPRPPNQLFYDHIFSLTQSEASVETADSFRTGDGSVVEVHDSEIAKAPKCHRSTSPLPAMQKTHVEGTMGKDGDIQIPIFPYRHLTTRCRARKCPIKGKHEKGPYLHEGKLRARDGNIFGASNPPQEVWDAYDRIKDDDNGYGGKGKDKVAAADVKLVTRFARLHFGEAVDWGIE